MTKFASDLLNAAVKAQKSYVRLTGGYWLGHAPESYLQILVAQDLHDRSGYSVYPEGTQRSVSRDSPVLRGRKAARSQKRFDLVLWAKSSLRVKALIECKKYWGVGSKIRSDVDKMKRQVRLTHFSKASGYMVIYSDAKSRECLESRFVRIAEQNDLRHVAGHFGSKPDQLGNQWAIAIFRLKRRKVKTDRKLAA